MGIDRDQFIDQGYIILRNIIPSNKLRDMRASSEIILERQKRIWASEMSPSDPPGGIYETARQPRVVMELPGLIDAKTANVVEDFWLANKTLDIAEQLLCNPVPQVTQMWIMCNPLKDHPGGTGWHRDIHPSDMAPMDALTADLTENGPRYTQWNVPLYDDNVLWVVPGSHRRRNTEQENTNFLIDLKQPITGGTPVELKAGDGVIYSNFLLHTGSNYMNKTRRTLHGGHAIFGDYPELGFIENLSASAQEKFEGFTDRTEHMKNMTESALRAVMDKDTHVYRKCLESMQPGAGPAGKTVLTIYLCKAALHIRALKTFSSEVKDPAYRRAMVSHPITLNWGPEFASRFTIEESELLWRRFEILDSNLQDDVEMFEPGFQSGPMYYYFNELPENVDTESFIASWSKNE